ncbi:HIT domain-containing protein [Candidatus Kaiserbacteria bacterium]|nr:HIT domain-containing protein [Candidatus Kaiserbacteria bacterium]
MKCIYCESPDIRAREITRNEYARAFPTNIPIVPGHVLVAPVRCVEHIEDLTEEEHRALFALITAIKRALRKSLDAEGFNCAWNDGEVAGQSIPHLHIHIVPRKAGDTGILEYEPRKFLYRPGSREKAPEMELIAVAKAIEEALGAH